jgi:hypothetical protein
MIELPEMVGSKIYKTSEHLSKKAPTGNIDS